MQITSQACNTFLKAQAEDAKVIKESKRMLSPDGAARTESTAPKTRTKSREHPAQKDATSRTTSSRAYSNKTLHLKDMTCPAKRLSSTLVITESGRLIFHSKTTRKPDFACITLLSRASIESTGYFVRNSDRNTFPANTQNLGLAFRCREKQVQCVYRRFPATFGTSSLKSPRHLELAFIAFPRFGDSFIFDCCIATVLSRACD